MSRFDLIAFLAVLTCVSFVVGLRDVPLRQPAIGVVAPPPPQDAGERDGQLEVVAVADDGAPLSGATVRVLWEQGGLYYLAARATTDGSGRALLEGLPRGAAWVLVEADGRSRSSSQVVIDDELRRLQIVLAESHRLAVVVRDEHGDPIREATVLVTAGDPLPYGALTDVRGRARFEQIGASPWTVKASAAGFESITRSGVVADLTLELRRLGSLEVRVELPGGQPAIGAVVLISGSALWPARRTETDDSGAIRIAGLLSGSYDLRATLGELVSPSLHGFQLERGAHESVTLRLVSGRMVRALVVDGDEDDARVVPNADVVLAESGLSSFPLRGRTGTDGTVTLGPIGPGPATLAARAAEFVSSSAVAVPEKLEGPVRVGLVRGGTLLGEVVDTKDRPVDGASIEVVGTDRDGLPIADTPVTLAFRRTHFAWSLSGPTPLIPAGELGVMPGPVPPIPPPGAAIVPGGLATAIALPAGGEPEAEIDPWVTRWDGSFTARPVTPGRLRALVRHPAFVEELSELVTLSPGGEAKVKVVLRAGGAIEGRVVDSHGRPLAGVRVDLNALRGTLERTTITATDGAFAFAAVPEDVILSLARPDDPSRIVHRKAIEVKEGETTRVELTLPPQREEVRVSVRAEGAPVDAAQVTLLSVDPNVPLRQTWFTGGEGVVTVQDARGLDLRVVVEAPGFTRAFETIERAPAEIAITLVRGVIVTGRVTAVRGRKYLSHASVTVVSEGHRAAALSDSQGEFSLSDVEPGPVRVIVSHPEYATVELDALIVATGRADRPFELPAVDLPEPSAVEGEVVDAAGKPVSGARVAAGIVPAYLPAGALPPGLAVTDRKGRFTLSDLAPGKHDVEAYAPDVGRGVARGIEVVAGRATGGVRIRLVAGRTDSDPAVGASLALTLGERGSGDELEIVIVQVAAGSEAERAGVRVGDLVLSVDGVDVWSMSDARLRMSGREGSDVVLELDRNGALVRLRVAREPVRR
jgi:protocatechuate 3,4-dioxygenase beta subunit